MRFKDLLNVCIREQDFKLGALNWKPTTSLPTVTLAKKLVTGERVVTNF